MKKLKVVTALSVLLATFAPACSAKAQSEAKDASIEAIKTVSFSDISEHWAKESIEKAVQKGYVDGYEDGTFKPDQSVSRAEFIKMVATALNLPVRGNTSGSDWYKPYVTVAEADGIHMPKDFADAEWNKPITRQEMARIAVRAGLEGYKKSETSDEDFMFQATKTGLIQGMNGGDLAKEEATTRAQSVTIIERILTVKAGGTLEVDKYAMSNAEMELTGSNIQTMWGMKVKPLPMEFDTGYGNVKGVVSKIMIVDQTDTNFSDHEHFAVVEADDALPPLGKDNNYVVGFYMTLTVTEPSKGFYIGSQSFAPATPRYRHVGLMNNKKYTFVNRFFSLEEAKSYEGWYFVAIPKEFVDDRLEKGTFMGLLLLPVNRSGEIRFTIHE
jgi:hypothetical protein